MGVDGPTPFPPLAQPARLDLLTPLTQLTLLTLLTLLTPVAPREPQNRQIIDQRVHPDIDRMPRITRYGDPPGQPRAWSGDGEVFQRFFGQSSEQV
jgi:hypothetical protein